MPHIEPAPARRSSWPFMSAHAEHAPQLAANGTAVPTRQEVEFADGNRIWLRRVLVDGRPSATLRDLGEPAEGARVDLLHLVPALAAQLQGANAREVAFLIAQQLRTHYATREDFLEAVVRHG